MHARSFVLSFQLVELYCKLQVNVYTAVNDVGGEMAGFCSSLAGDRAAVSAVCEGLSDGKPQSFVTALSTCTGTIFTSGIGSYFSSRPLIRSFYL